MRPISSKDLQELIAANIISEEKAFEIETYFNNKRNTSPSRLNIVFGILGALLVSLGIILLIAHNWDDLSITVKTIFAFLPLAIGQLLGVYTISYNKESDVWREVSAIVLFFAVPSSISLISQVYHVDGTLAQFLFTWILLAAPIVYLLQSTVVALLLIAVASWYATEVSYGYDSDIAWLYLAVMLFLIPHYLNYFKHKRDSNFFYWYNWFISVSALICLGGFSGAHFNSSLLLFAGYLSLVTLFYQAGKSLSLKEQNFFSNPFLKLGITGIIVILLMLSFEEFWFDFTKNSIPATSPFIYLSVIFFAWCTYNFIKENIQSRWRNIDPLEASIYIFCMVAFTNTTIGILVINLWLIVIAVWYIRKGSAKNNFGLLNFGLLIIASLAVIRFFDDEIPFVWRGFFFLVAGLGFFAANYNLIRKRKQMVQKDKA